MKTQIQLCPSVLVKTQFKEFGPVLLDGKIKGYKPGAKIFAKVRYDDQCGNGHNTFSITGHITEPGARDWASGGCIHNEIAKCFPELAPLIKWHLTSADGPMHYPGNVTYLAGDRDHWGLKEGEFRQHTSRGPHQAEGKPGVPHWELHIPDNVEQTVYADQKPAPVTLQWRPCGITGDGKKRELLSARSCAVWPEATDEQLSLPKAELEALLMARLPALMAEFKAAVESLGFIY